MLPGLHSDAALVRTDRLLESRSEGPAWWVWVVTLFLGSLLGAPSQQETTAVLPLPAVPHALGAASTCRNNFPVSFPEGPAISNSLLISLKGQGDFTPTFKSTDPDCKYPAFEDARIIYSSNSLCNLFKRFSQIVGISWPRCSRDCLLADTGSFSLGTGLKHQSNFAEFAELR